MQPYNITELLTHRFSLRPKISLALRRILTNSTYYIMEKYYISLSITPITCRTMMNKSCTDEQVGTPVEARSTLSSGDEVIHLGRRDWGNILEGEFFEIL